ncbi:MAG: hypothetical protein CYG59_16430 [Chloroflexi bacterium]|nr:MAG: hypothetical protein CYG59_16430 [Chloroflexota bacterium]
MNTADRIITALQPYGLKIRGNKGKSHSPLRADSDSNAFAITIDDSYGGGGKWFDHVAGEGGNFIELARRLDVKIDDEPAQPPVLTAKQRPTYADLADYVNQEHGGLLDVFRAAGWHDSTWYESRSIEFPTPNGPRHRLIDGGPNKYIQPGGYVSCLYGLDWAVEHAATTGQDLVLCNGEASTVVAQHYGVAAFCQNMGEKQLTDANLVELQRKYPQGSIIVALDCDDKGRKAAYALVQQLRAVGYEVRAVDLNGGKGFDLSNFARLHTHETAHALLALQDLPPLDTCGHLEEIERLRAENEQLRREKLRMHERIQWMFAALGNKEIGAGARLTAVFTKIEADANQRKVAEGAAVPVCVARIADQSGQSPNAVGRHLKELEAAGAWKKEYKRHHDPTTGAPVTEVTLELLPAIERPLSLRPPEPRNHGGKRLKKCESCGSENFVERTTIVCASCGVIHGEPKERDVHLEIRQDPASGNEKTVTVAQRDEPTEPEAITQDAAWAESVDTDQDIFAPDTETLEQFAIPQVGGSKYVPTVFSSFDTSSDSPITQDDGWAEEAASESDSGSAAGDRDGRSHRPTPPKPTHASPFAVTDDNWRALQLLQADIYAAEGRHDQAQYLRKIAGVAA